MQTKIIPQDCYIETYHEGDGAFNRELAMMLKMGFLEQHTNMVIMTKEDFINAIKHVFNSGRDSEVCVDFPNATKYVDDLFK